MAFFFCVKYKIFQKTELKQNYENKIKTKLTKTKKLPENHETLIISNMRP